MTGLIQITGLVCCISGKLSILWATVIGVKTSAGYLTVFTELSP